MLSAALCHCEAAAAEQCEITQLKKGLKEVKEERDRERITSGWKKGSQK